MTVNIIRYDNILLYTFNVQAVNHSSSYAGFRLPPLKKHVLRTFCYIYMHSILSRLMGISELKPVLRNIEKHWKIDKKYSNVCPALKIESIKCVIHKWIHLFIYLIHSLMISIIDGILKNWIIKILYKS